MSLSPKFLTFEQVLALHKIQIEQFGGSHGVKDEGLLLSALAQPEAGFREEYLHKDLQEMAAAYLFHLVKNHAFNDGNKRIAALTASVFLQVNGLKVVAPIQGPASTGVAESLLLSPCEFHFDHKPSAPYSIRMPLAVLKKVASSLIDRIVKEALDGVFPKKRGEPPPRKTPQETPPKEDSAKSHPWRLCPIGMHWVREHELTLPPTLELPERETLRRGHCRTNPSGREIYTSDELREIARLHFEGLRNNPEAMPVPDPWDYPNQNRYDLSIAGWTKFWNETLNPDDPLTPDLIKVLIATETSFRDLPDTPSHAGAARGPLQITESTRKILQDPKGELKEHLIQMTKEESREIDVNLAAGIRWLHHKRHLVKSRLKREVTWDEAAAEYKGIFKDIGRDEKTDEIMKKLKGLHEEIRNKRSSFRTRP
ncbi:MAG: type II toxin-antitoxin system death-on-curing family toxin [Bdellovibrionales bacterium]|nr:type II toxin-antitoxin system death-on-curing family toxin [Bdellovibrionales bacterium]